MAYKNKTYVCFDADNDMAYYRPHDGLEGKRPDSIQLPECP